MRREKCFSCCPASGKKYREFRHAVKRKHTHLNDDGCTDKSAETKMLLHWFRSWHAGKCREEVETTSTTELRLCLLKFAKNKTTFSFDFDINFVNV